MKKYLFFDILIFLFSLHTFELFATTVNVYPQSASSGLSGASTAPVSEAKPSGENALFFKGTCYGTNNRSTNNPISPSSTITATVKVGGVVKLRFSFKGKLASRTPPVTNFEDDAQAPQDRPMTYSERVSNLLYTHVKMFCEMGPSGSDNQKLCNKELSDEGATNALNAAKGFINANLTTGSFPASPAGGTAKSAEVGKFKGKTAQFITELLSNTEAGKLSMASTYNTQVAAVSGLARGYCLLNPDQSDEAKGGLTDTQKTCLKQTTCSAICALKENASIYGNCKTECLTDLNPASTPDLACKAGLGTSSLSSTGVACQDRSLVYEGINWGAGGNVEVTYEQTNTGRPTRVNFYAWDGPITVKPSWSWGQNGSLNLEATFPGQDGYCGGYHSPLMVFFNKKYPKFSNVVNFLRKDIDGVKTFWPEKNHHGYFLALLKKGKEKQGIWESSQVFGQNGYYLDGFRALSAIDSNFDGKITKADDEFKRLVLWKDKNSDGRSQKGELFTLKEMGIYRFDIHDRDTSFTMHFGRRANARGRANFYYVDPKDKSHRKKTGELIDIFFHEYLPE